MTQFAQRLAFLPFALLTGAPVGHADGENYLSGICCLEPLVTMALATLPTLSGEGFGPVYMSYTSESEVSFYWDVIERRARERLPTYPHEYTEETNRRYKEEVDAVMLCRKLMAARHDGWVAATPEKADPLPPVSLW